MLFDVSAILSWTNSRITFWDVEDELYVQRDNSLRDIVFHHLLSDVSSCKLEQGCSAFNYKKPGDIFHPDFLDGLPAYFDITVHNSLLPQFINVAATYPGAAADAGERKR